MDKPIARQCRFCGRLLDDRGMCADVEDYELHPRPVKHGFFKKYGA